MERDAVPTPTLVCAIEYAALNEPGRIVYLQCEEPLTWTEDRKAAQVFSDPLEAQRLAQENRAPLFFSYTVPAEKAGDRAKAVPARYRRRNEIHEPLERPDWRANVPNAGVE